MQNRGEQDAQHAYPARESSRAYEGQVQDPPMTRRGASQAIEDTLLAQVQETIARLRGPAAVARRLTEEELGKMEEEARKLESMREEKEVMDGEVRRLKKANEEVKKVVQELKSKNANEEQKKTTHEVKALQVRDTDEEQKTANEVQKKAMQECKLCQSKRANEEQKKATPELKSRWSSETEISICNSIEDISDSEEPEIGEADVVIVPHGTFYPAGSAKLINIESAATRQARREERERAVALLTLEGKLDVPASPKAEVSPAFNETDRSKDADRSKATEPFPTYYEQPGAIEEYARQMDLDRNKSQSSTQTWVNRHGDVRDRPQTTRFDPAVMAERNIPPAPLPKDSYTSPRAPPFATAPPMRQSNAMSPPRTAMPLPFPPRTPTTPQALSGSAFSTPSASRVPLPTSPPSSHHRAPLTLSGHSRHVIPSPRPLRPLPPSFSRPLPFSSPTSRPGPYRPSPPPAFFTPTRAPMHTTSTPTPADFPIPPPFLPQSPLSRRPVPAQRTLGSPFHGARTPYPPPSRPAKGVNEKGAGGDASGSDIGFQG